MKNKGFKVVEDKVGDVTSYNELRKHAEVILNSTLCIGDKIKVKGKGYEWEQKVESMFINHKPVAKAWAGQTMWIGVEKPVKPGDKIFLLKTDIETQPVSPQPLGPKHFPSKEEDKREGEEKNHRKKKRPKNKSRSSGEGGKSSGHKSSPGGSSGPDVDIGDVIDFIKNVSETVSEPDDRTNSGKGEDQKTDRSGNKKDSGSKGENSVSGTSGRDGPGRRASAGSGGAGGEGGFGGGKSSGSRVARSKSGSGGVTGSSRSRRSGGKSGSRKGKGKGSGG